MGVELTKRQVVWLGRATWWPVIYMVLFMGFMVLWMLGIFGLGGAGAVLGETGSEAAGVVVGGVMAAMFGAFSIMFVFHIATILLIMALLGFYIAHTIKNPALEEGNQRLMWVLVVIFGGFIGQLIYYHQQIRSTD